MAVPYETKWSGAYHLDLRCRMVWQRWALNHVFSETAANLYVNQATLRETVDLFETTGDICEQSYPKHRLQIL